MNLEYFITDIDNTIADTTGRLRRSLREIGREEVFAKTSDRFGGFSDHLNPQELEEFWGLFLSDDFLHLDKPAPGAAEFLLKVVDEGIDLIYLTGRHDQPEDTMRPGTESWLEENGFPVPDGSETKLFMKPKRYMEDKKFKLDLLGNEFSDKLNSPKAVGVGDHPNDALIYNQAGVKPILLDWPGLFTKNELRDSASGVAIMENWAEVEEEVNDMIFE